MIKFDLHCHSHFSDGQLSPTELLALANEKGVTHLALTDHDTLNGLNEASIAARQQSINLINGVELSCSWNGQLLHIVGLGFDPENCDLKKGVAKNVERRFIRAEAMHQDFLEHKIDLRDEVARLLNDAAPTRPHFAQALVNLGYAKDIRQAFKRFLVQGKPGYVAMQWASLEEVGSWLRAAGGVAVLAHPLRYKLTRTKLIVLIKEMQMVGINGIEVSTSTTDKQQSEMLANLAVEYKLLASTGSDFHTLNQPWAQLGGAPQLPSRVTPVWNQLGY